MASNKSSQSKLDGFLSRSAVYSVPKKRTVERNLHLGIDYGTSSSKLVLTDYSAVGGEVSFVVRPPKKHGGDGGYRIPSSISISENWLQFGYRAEQLIEEAKVYRSLKMRCAYPNRYYGDKNPLPEDWIGRERDLATLYVGYLIQLGQFAAQDYSNRFEMKSRVGLTMGAPMKFLDSSELSSMFVQIVREANWLSQTINLLEKVSISDAKSALTEARNEISRSVTEEPRMWIRSEAEAALFWAYKSPEIDQGRYAYVDIGAGTTSASWFHITAEVEDGVLLKRGMKFYGAACNPPACDAVDEALLSQMGGVKNLAEIRGKESQIVEKLSSDQMAQFNMVLCQIGSVFEEASQSAYRKDALLSHWLDSRARIFFLGGGSKIDAIRRLLIETKGDWLRPSPIVDPGVPADLFELNGNKLIADPIFLLVAYGLARRLGDVPFSSTPSEVSDYSPTYTVRTPIESEHLYSD